MTGFGGVDEEAIRTVRVFCYQPGKAQELFDTSKYLAEFTGTAQQIREFIQQSERDGIKVGEEIVKGPFRAIERLKGPTIELGPVNEAHEKVLRALGKL